MASHPHPRIAQEYAGLTQIVNGHPAWTGRFRELPDRLEQPLTWRKPRRIFVNSMSDLFGEGVSDDFLDGCFAIMALASQHTFQVLTKRPERLRRYLTAVPEEGCGWVPGALPRWNIQGAIDQLTGESDRAFSDDQWDMSDGGLSDHWPLPNVWLGVSCEDQRWADERIPLLLATPAAVRFISAEPLLGPVDLLRLTPHGHHDYLTGERLTARVKDYTAGLDWVIAGAESGPGARLMDEEWVRSLKDQCVAAGRPFFFKQAAVNGRKIHTPLLDGRRWMEYPRKAVVSG